MTYYNQVIDRLTGIRDNTSGVSSSGNQSRILDDLVIIDGIVDSILVNTSQVWHNSSTILDDLITVDGIVDSIHHNTSTILDDVATIDGIADLVLVNTSSIIDDLGGVILNQTFIICNQSVSSANVSHIKSEIDNQSYGLSLIKIDVDDIMDLIRNASLISISSNESALYIDDSPTYNKDGVSIKVNLSNLASGDTYNIYEKYRIENGGGYIKFSSDDNFSYYGVQDPAGITIPLEPYRYGAMISMKKIGGTNRTIAWESFSYS